jgi:flagellar export protein FliJ
VAALDTIIRLHRWQLDERRQQLAELERLDEKLRGEALRLADELAVEQKVAGGSEEASFAYGAYAKALLERQAKLQASLAEVEGQIVTARDALSQAFAEVKRYEMAQATRTRRARAGAARKEQAHQDDLGLQMYRRGKAG